MVSGEFRTCVWNGKEYPSLSHAARELGITKEAMRLRVNKGYVCDDDLPEGAKKPKREKLSDIELQTIRRYVSSRVQTMDTRQIARRFGLTPKELGKLLADE